MNRAGFLKRMAFAAVASAFIDVERLLPTVDAPDMVRVVWIEETSARAFVKNWDKGSYLPDHAGPTYIQREEVAPNPDVDPDGFEALCALAGIPNNPSRYRTFPLDRST